MRRATHKAVWMALIAWGTALPMIGEEGLINGEEALLLKLNLDLLRGNTPLPEEVEALAAIPSDKRSFEVMATASTMELSGYGDFSHWHESAAYQRFLETRRNSIRESLMQRGRNAADRASDDLREAVLQAEQLLTDEARRELRQVSAEMSRLRQAHQRGFLNQAFFNVMVLRDVNRGRTPGESVEDYLPRHVELLEIVGIPVPTGEGKGTIDPLEEIMQRLPHSRTVEDVRTILESENQLDDLSALLVGRAQDSLNRRIEDLIEPLHIHPE